MSPPLPEARMEGPSTPPPITETGAWRIFVIPALLALIGYIGFYACDSRLRSRQGPWEVTFATNSSGTPLLRISQPGLGITGVEVEFQEAVLTNPAPALPATVRFDAPNRGVPFGRTAFDDLMYLPGTVVLHCFGHEVQLVPRRLYLNRQGAPWESAARYELRPGDRLPTLEPPPKPGRSRPGS